MAGRSGVRSGSRTNNARAAKVGIHRAHVYLVGNRLYQIVVRGPKEVATSAEATKYLESFKLVK